MAGCVLDASAATALLLPSQGTAAALAFAQAPPPDLIAPLLFRVEVRNAIVTLEHRGLLPPGSVDANLARLEANIVFVPPPDDAGLTAMLSLARQEKLKAYDATYLELAIRMATSVASRDKNMIAAAQKRGVQVFDLR